jgi:hypothetical protein
MKPFVRYHIDPAQGYLTSGIVTINDKGVEAPSFLLEAKKCSKDRWFPMRSVRVVPTTGPNGPTFFVRKIEVVELEVDRRPAAEEFQIDLPAGTLVVVQNGKDSGYRIKQDESVDLDDMNKLLEVGQNVISNPLSDTEIHSRADRRIWYWMAGIAVIALALVLPFALKRLRRDK